MPPSVIHSTQVAWQEAWSAVQGSGMTLTKTELADLLFEKIGLNKREAKDRPGQDPGLAESIQVRCNLPPLSSALRPNAAMKSRFLCSLM